MFVCFNVLLVKFPKVYHVPPLNETNFATGNKNKTKMNINEISRNGNMQLVLNIADLKEIFLEWFSESKQAPVTEDESFLTAKELCNKYRVSKTTLWRNIDKGIWPKPIKVGRRALYGRHHIDVILGRKRNKK